MVRGRFLLIALFFSSVGSLFFSSYFETIQSGYLSKLKNYIQHGDSSRFLNDKEYNVVRTIYNGKYYFNPVHIAQSVIYTSEEIVEESLKLGIGFHDDNKSVYPQALHSEDKVINVADFFIKHYKPEEINGVEVIRLPYEFDYASYDLNAPWYSGMAQGQVSTVMISAYLITKDESYLDFAIKAISLMNVLVEDGGVRVDLSSEHIWIEEYADRQLNRESYPLVLNGNLFAIDGVFMLYKLTNDPVYYNILEKALLGLEHHIDKYDAGFWSYYDIKNNFAHVGYHRLHIKQLERALIYSKHVGIDKMERVSFYINKFKMYDSFPVLGYMQRMIFQKNNMIYLIFIINFIIFFLLIYVLRRFLSTSS